MRRGAAGRREGFVLVIVIFFIVLLFAGVATFLRRADLQAKLHGKDCMHMAGEYNVESLVRGLTKFLARHAPQLNIAAGSSWLNAVQRTKESAAELLGALPMRPPTFCTGCPERPVFSAMKLVAKDIGRPHVSMDVGCHCFGSFEPFSQGNTLLGYGMSLASAAGVNPMSSKRAVAIMGDSRGHSRRHRSAARGYAGGAGLEPLRRPGQPRGNLKGDRSVSRTERSSALVAGTT